jgi:hypothetical protein
LFVRELDFSACGGIPVTRTVLSLRKRNSPAKGDLDDNSRPNDTLSSFVRELDFPHVSEILC